MPGEGSYDPVIVFDWLDTHCTRRDDGRFIKLGRKLLEDSHRDTFDRWIQFAEEDPTWRVPLGRLDEILLTYGVMLYEFETWATDVYGTCGYADADCPQGEDNDRGA